VAIVILPLKLRFRGARYVTHVRFFVSKDLLRERSSECGNGGRTSARWKVCNIDVNWALGPRHDRACPPSDFGACSSLRANQIRLGVPSGFTMRASLATCHVAYILPLRGGACCLSLLDEYLELSLHGFGTFEIENDVLLINAKQIAYKCRMDKERGSL
jgi:hypothetical protein